MAKQAPLSVRRVTDFLNAFVAFNPVYTKKIVRLSKDEPDLFYHLADSLLAWAEKVLGDEYPERLFRGYEFFVTEVNEAQLRYESDKKYRFSNFNEVAEHTYASREFMEFYHWGVYVTTFAWQHHLAIYQFFKKAFLTRLAKSKGGKILDLGCGSGVWSLLSLSELSNWSSVGVDISPTSVAWANELATFSGFADRAVFVEGDALLLQQETPAQAGVSCFLLEHLERPDLLLQNMHANLDGGALAFITTAVTAAEIDHIYEFKKESEAVSMLEDYGFSVMEMLSSAPEPYPADRQYKPRSVGFVARKKTTAYW